MDSPRSYAFMIALVVLVMGFSLLGLGNLMCKQAVRSCYLGETCPNNTVCVKYGPNNARCSPNFCASVQSTNTKVYAFIHDWITYPVWQGYDASAKWVKSRL